MTGPTYVGSSGVSGTNGSAVANLPIPSGTQVGDLLVAICQVDTTSSSTWTTPSGWAFSSASSSANVSAEVFSKKATSADIGSTATFTPSVSSSGTAVSIVAYRNAAFPASPAWTPYTASSTTTFTAAAQTAAAGDALIVAYLGAYGTGFSSGPSDMVQRVNKSTNGYVTQVVYTQDALPAGSTGTKTGTWSSGTPGQALSFRVPTPDNPPNAPTLTSPANNSTIDRSITQRFAWLFSDPDAGDSQSKFDLQWWALTGPGGSRVGSATTVTQAIPNNFYDFAASYWAAGSYEWQVRTYDSHGVVGPWSASSFFTAADAPTPPTITAPTSGGTISSGTATVTWSEPNQDSYQIRRVADNAGAADPNTVYYDSGEVVDAVSRSTTLTFETNNRWEHIEVRVKYSGLWSSWSDIRVDVSYTPPATPTVVLTPDSTGGKVTVAITNPAPGTGQPATSYNDVYQRSPAATPNADTYLPYSDAGTRVATSLATNATYTDPWPASGVAYEYQVLAIASNGTTSASGWVSL